MEAIILTAKRIAKNNKLSLIQATPLCFVTVICSWIAMCIGSNMFGAGGYSVIDVFNMMSMLGALIVTAVLTLAIYAERRKINRHNSPV